MSTTVQKGAHSGATRTANNMDGYRQFKTVMYGWYRYIGLCMGNDILRDDFRPHAYTGLITVATSSIPCVYVLAYFYFDGEIALKSGAFIGTGIKCAMKPIFMLIARPRIVESVKFLCQIYEQNYSTTENQQDFCHFAGILKPCIRWLILYFLSCIAGGLMIPIIVYVCGVSREMILPVYLPGMSLDSNIHYAVHLIYQAILLIFAVLAYLHFDIMFLVQLLHVILMTDLLRHKIRAISEMTVVNSPASHIEIAVNLRNVINLHNELRRYMAKVQDLYYYPIAIIVTLAAGTIGYKIYTILTMEVAQIFFCLVIVVETLELAYFCAMGTMVDVCFDRFYHELIDCKWYQLPLIQQKAFILLLNTAKEPNNLNVADIMPLNAHTFSIMVNHIFSFVVVLRRTIQDSN